MRVYFEQTNHYNAHSVDQCLVNTTTISRGHLTRKWVLAVLAHEEVNLAIHVFVVDGATLLVRHSITLLEWLLEALRPFHDHQQSFSVQQPAKH
jgi:hypothetical protein